ncbi:hypothetical protein F4778DRAFT_290608 [Xylariomycetidae sp. FL2044]|nr:hypothetical protein F4778DRAFT_290608 [Xylariomycetidae sp. FL2044]
MENDSHESSRLAKLRHFVCNLSPREIHYLKIVMLPFKIDFIDQISVEILAQIVTYLCPEDFAVCLVVSRAWRAKFLSEHAMSTLCKVYWPYSDRGLLTRESFVALLQRTVRASIGGHHRSSFHFSYSLDRLTEAPFKPHPDYHVDLSDFYAQEALFDERFEKPCPQYSGGKIAFVARDCLVILDDLFTMTRKILTTRRGPIEAPRIKLLAMGNRLLVGQAGHLLIMWDLINGHCIEKRLPGEAKCACTHDERVALEMFSGDLLIWHSSYGLASLSLASDSTQSDEDGNGNDNGNNNDENENENENDDDGEHHGYYDHYSKYEYDRLFFSHYEASTLFFSTVTHRPATVTFTVHEYRDRAYVRAYTLDYASLSDKERDNPWFKDLPYEIHAMPYYGRELITFYEHSCIRDSYIAAEFDVRTRSFHFRYTDPTEPRNPQDFVNRDLDFDVDLTRLEPDIHVRSLQRSAPEVDLLSLKIPHLRCYLCPPQVEDEDCS